MIVNNEFKFSREMCTIKYRKGKRDDIGKAVKLHQKK